MAEAGTVFTSAPHCPIPTHRWEWPSQDGERCSPLAQIPCPASVPTGVAWRSAQRVALAPRKSRDGLEVAAPPLRTDLAGHDLAVIRREEVHAPPAALAAVRPVLVARNVFGHIPELPAGHHRGRCWRRCGRLRRHHRHTGRERAGASRSRAEQGAPQKGTAGQDRAVRANQCDADFASQAS